MLAADLLSPRREGQPALSQASTHLSAFLADAAQRWPEDRCRVADLDLTYQAAWIHVLRIATWLQQNGVARGDKVVMVLRQRSEMQLIVLAIAHMGAVVTILSEHERSERFREIVDEAQPSCMFLERATGHLRKHAEEVLTVWVGESPPEAGPWDAEYDELMSTSPAFGMRFPGTAQDPAFLVYSPEGGKATPAVVVSHDHARLLIASQAARGAAGMAPMEFFQTSAREQLGASAAFAALADRI